MHWDMLNKATKFEFSLFNVSHYVICSPVWRFVLRDRSAAKGPLKVFCNVDTEGERALTFIKKCPVMFTHLNSLPNNQLRVNYMIAVWLELLKQLVFFWPDFVTQLVLKFKGRGYFMKAQRGEIA